MIFFQLFLTYLKIGFFGFGGGYAMLSLIQNEVVVQHQWMSNAEFADIVAISQITPGPIAINSATYLGYTVGMQYDDHVFFGIIGALVATFAVCLPALTLMLLITRFYIKLRNNVIVEGVVRGMSPVVIGMIAAAALMLMFPRGDMADDANFVDIWSWIIFAGVFVGAVLKVNPIWLIVLSAISGILIYYVPTVI